jgi:hypothetical protein
VVPDPALPVYAAIAPWAEKDNSYYFSLLYSVGEAFNFEIKTPWNQLSDEQRDVLLNGSREAIMIKADSRYQKSAGYERPFEGILPILERQLRDASGESIRQKLEKFLELVPCATCHGLRLKPEALAVRVGPYAIHELTAVSVGETLSRIEALMGVGASEGAPPLLNSRQIQIGDLVLREIRMRLKFLLDVGLDYLSLDRPAMTLSGGEAQRIRLATQIGAGLTGVLYVLDEPSIGLHPRDTQRLAALRERYGMERVKWMLRQRNLTIFPNLQIVDIQSLQLRYWQPLAVNKTRMHSHCLAPIGEAPAARAFRIRQYEEFFNHSGLATSDDNLMYAFCQDGYPAAAGRMASQGYARGLAPAGERRYCGDELGLGSPYWTYGNREYGDETCFHAGHREWLRLMSREDTP